MGRSIVARIGLNHVIKKNVFTRIKRLVDKITKCIRVYSIMGSTDPDWYVCFADLAGV